MWLDWGWCVCGRGWRAEAGRGGSKGVRAEERRAGELLERGVRTSGTFGRFGPADDGAWVSWEGASVGSCSRAQGSRRESLHRTLSRSRLSTPIVPPLVLATTPEVPPQRRAQLARERFLGRAGDSFPRHSIVHSPLPPLYNTNTPPTTAPTSRNSENSPGGRRRTPNDPPLVVIPGTTRPFDVLFPKASAKISQQ